MLYSMSPRGRRGLPGPCCGSCGTASHSSRRRYGSAFPRAAGQRCRPASSVSRSAGWTWSPRSRRPAHVAPPYAGWRRRACRVLDASRSRGSCSANLPYRSVDGCTRPDRSPHRTERGRLLPPLTFAMVTVAAIRRPRCRRPSAPPQSSHGFNAVLISMSLLQVSSWSRLTALLLEEPSQ